MFLLHYERTHPVPHPRRLPSIGSIGCAVVLAAGIGAIITLLAHLPSYANNEWLNRMLAISCFGGAIGIAGLFQPRGRRAAILALLMGLASALLIPALFTA